MSDKGISYNSDTLSELKSMYKNLRNDEKKIVLLNQEIDNKIQDILHYVELKKFRVSDGYRAIKNLKDLLCEKRKNIDSRKEIIELLNFFEGKYNFTTANKNVVDIRDCNKQATIKILTKSNETTTESCLITHDHLFSDNVKSESFAIILAEMINQYNDRRTELKTAMSAVEKNMNLLLTKIEFGKFGLIEGYKFAKIVKEIRIERRRIKDEFDRFKYLDAVLLNNEKINPSVEKVKKQEELKQTRRYSPRVFKEYGIMTS